MNGYSWKRYNSYHPHLQSNISTTHTYLHYLDPPIISSFQFARQNPVYARFERGSWNWDSTNVRMIKRVGKLGVGVIVKIE